MAKPKAALSKDQHLKEFRSNAAWVAYVSLFRVIVPDNEKPLEVSIDEIDANTYNHGALVRIITTLPLVAAPDFQLLFCYDGALALPQYGMFRDKHSAVLHFSNVLCALLLGGIFCEAIDIRDVAIGKLHNKQQLWPVDLGESLSSYTHATLRMRSAGSLERIILSKPAYIMLSEFHKAYEFGLSVLDAIPNMSPQFLISGVTQLEYQNWPLALADLWIIAEQLTEYLWSTRFLTDDAYQPSQKISGRITSMGDDHRTWSVAVKQEILFQTDIFPEEAYTRLYPARQARNRLQHDGKLPTEADCIALYEALLSLINACVLDGARSIGKINRRAQPPKRAQQIAPHTKDYFADWLAMSEKL